MGNDTGTVMREPSALRLGPTGLLLLQQWEGYSPVAYLDEAGVWTIGYGHTRDVRPGQTCTREVAEQWLLDDAEIAERAVQHHVRVPLSQLQYDALVSLAFNIGYSAFGNSALVRRLNARDYDAVPDQMRRWNKITKGGKKVVSKGLTRRREAEIGVWLMGTPRPSAKETSARPVPAEKPTVTEVAIKTDTGKGALTVGGAVAAAGAVLQAAKEHLPALEAAVRETPLALALVAVVAVVVVLIWKKMKD